MNMSRIAILLAMIVAVAYAGSYVLPTTQDFAVVNQDRIASSIARNDIITLFNNGLTSSISYYGFDTTGFLQEASITTNSPVRSMIENARLVFKNFTILGTQSGAINIQITGLNPGQMWDENTVTLSTTPTINGGLGTVDFSSAEPSLDVTNAFVDALTAPYQGAMFGFHIGLPGGPVELPSHRVDSDAVVLEIEYSPIVGPGGTAPPTNAPTTSTTRAPTTAAPTAGPTTSTAAPPLNCWTCGAGYVHWYEVPGAAPESDPCACIRATAPATSTTSQPTQAETSTTTLAPGQTTTARPTEAVRNFADKTKVSVFVSVVAGLLVLLL